MTDRLDRNATYYTMAQVAKVLGWETRRTRDWLMRSGATMKINGRWVTTKTMLRESFEDAWAEYFYSDEDEMSESV